MEEPNGSSRNEVKCVAVICVISALPLKPRGWAAREGECFLRQLQSEKLPYNVSC